MPSHPARAQHLQRPKPGEASDAQGKEVARRQGLCATVSRSHMEPDPWAPPRPSGGQRPHGEQRGGHEAPTCLGSHRGAEEGLETGGTELADRPHAAEACAGHRKLRRGRREQAEDRRVLCG